MKKNVAIDKKPKITDKSVLTYNVKRYRDQLCSENINLDKKLNSGAMERVEFTHLMDKFDLILFDAYGVLNRGAASIDGAVATIDSCIQHGINFLVVSNNASEKPKSVWQKLNKLGFAIKPEQIVTSGMAIKPYLRSSPYSGLPYLLIGTRQSADYYGEDPSRLLLNPPDSPLKTDKQPAYILICSNRDYYGQTQQEVVEAELKNRPLPMLVANPDIIVQANDTESVVVAGFTAYELNKKYNCSSIGIGKPFAPVYQLALEKYPHIAPNKILMVGDSLTTDILGGAAMGFSTCLTLSGIHGLEANTIETTCQKWAIKPDYIVNSIGG
ncbi:MAG: HAD-IIA family hydrolase [Magnetococcales bacterium]|nr:HAD-IIA family hydrolase [Magnetococcales bacterium]